MSSAHSAHILTCTDALSASPGQASLERFRNPDFGIWAGSFEVFHEKFSKKFWDLF